MIEIEIYPLVDDPVLPDEAYQSMIAELHARIEQEFPWQSLPHCVELGGGALLLTLWSEQQDGTDPLHDLHEKQVEWLNAQESFVWAVQDCENREHLTSYSINSPSTGEMTCPRLERQIAKWNNQVVGTVH